MTEEVTYGTLKNGLVNCKKFDDYDSIFILKYLLNGYVDLQRSGV